MRLLQAIPALPVRDIEKRARFYREQLEDKAWGTREFAVRDLDNNLITFYEWRRC